MSTELIVQDNVHIEVSARGDAALAALEAEIAALPADKMSIFNVEPGFVAARALGAVPALRELHGRIARECPTADLKAIDQLEDRACALLKANVNYETALVTPPGFNSLAQEAYDARTVLTSVVNTFVTCNLLKPEQVTAVKGGRGFRDVADDILTQTGVLKNNWDRLEHKAPITRAQLERLQGVGEELTRLIGIREQLPQRASHLADVRLRVFTLLDRAYDEARRVVSYLRWQEQDVDTLLPALRSRGGGRTKGDDADAKANASTTKPGEPTKPAVPVIDTVVMQPVAPVMPMEIPPAPSGLPRNKPFGNV